MDKKLIQYYLENSEVEKYYKRKNFFFIIQTSIHVAILVLLILFVLYIR